MPSLIYTAELALGEEDIEPFLQWYAYRHAPDLHPIGFQSCACYRAVLGDMTFLDIYEIPAWEIFTSGGYARMAERDVYAAEILAKRRDKAHTLYQHRLLHPAPVEGEAPLDADWISVLRFDTAMAGDRLAEAMTDEAAHLSAQGAKAVRFAERTRDHPTYTTHRPYFLLMGEWHERPWAESSLFSRVEQRLGDEISNVRPFLGYRVYPWPDRPI